MAKAESKIEFRKLFQIEQGGAILHMIPVISTDFCKHRLQIQL